MQPAETIPVEDLPEKAAIAAYELIGHMLREQAEAITIRLVNLTNDGEPVGDFELAIRRVE